jgi:hypothetical protein
LDDILVGGKSLGLCGPKGKKQDCLVTVDSGTSNMAMPGWAFDQIANKIPTMSQGAPCNGAETFGKLTFIINGKEYSFQPQEWVFPPNKETGSAALAQLAAQD